MLSVISIGHFLPPARPVVELVAAAGGNPKEHSGWPSACIAGDADHPSSMGTAALRVALDQAGLKGSDLDLVLACGVSRDYPASWSVAIEIMRNLEVPSDRFGFDTSCGCAGAVVGLQIADGWLGQRGRGRAAVVTAERWSYTVNRGDPVEKTLWGHADGAAVMILEEGESPQAKALFRGTHFLTRSELNDVILVQYGGTRFPSPPPGTPPYLRRKKWAGTQDEYRAIQRANYASVFDGMRKDFGVDPDWVVCNQIGPGFVAGMAKVARVADDRVVVTGDETGHVGSADVTLGLERLIARKEQGTCFMGGSTAYAVAGAAFELRGGGR